MSSEISRLNGETAIDIACLDDRWGRRNVSSRGEKRRYDIEHRSGSQLTKLGMTLMHESVGIKQD